MDRAYPPVPSEAIEEALIAEALTEQLPGKWSAILAEPSASKLVLERQPHQVVTTLLTMGVMSTIKQESNIS